MPYKRGCGWALKIPSEPTNASGCRKIVRTLASRCGPTTGGGPGASATLDVANFCCPDYVVTMVERIRRNWMMNQGTAGQVVVRFVIQRDGTISEHEVEKSSGSPVLDLASLRAIVQTKGLPPLPAQYPGSTLPVHLIFEYR